MHIQLNGQPHEVSGNLSIAALLQALQLQDKRLAVEVNEHIIPRGQHATTCLQAGDRVEIVQAIGGG